MLIIGSRASISGYMPDSTTSRTILRKSATPKFFASCARLPDISTKGRRKVEKYGVVISMLKGLGITS